MAQGLDRRHSRSGSLNAPSGILGYSRPMAKPNGNDGSAGARRAFAIRRATLEILDGVQRRGQMLQHAGSRSSPLNRQDRSTVLFLAETTLRLLGRTDQLLDALVDRRPNPAGMDLLRLAVAEIHGLGATPELVVDQAVRLAKHRNSTRHLAGLVNAVLRNASSRSGADLWKRLPPGRLPEWIGEPIEDRHGVDVRAAIEAVHEVTPPLDLTPAGAEESEEVESVLAPTRLSTGTLRLGRRSAVRDLWGYNDGKWWVQDAAAAIPVRLLGSIEGMDVLDMCAAPGGKMLQCLSAGARVTAIDLSERRLERLHQNLERVGFSASVVVGDALVWEPGRLFDVVVVDAPCTATGTIRRNPDLPIVKSNGDELLRQLVPLQRLLLHRAVSLTKSGGRILYSVCSLLPDEGEAVAIAAAQEAGLSVLPIDCGGLGLDPDWVLPCGGLRTRPDHLAELGGMDGFYSVVLGKPN